MKPLSQAPNRKVLRFEQDQGRDFWVPEEDEDCIPHKLTYDFLVFLGKDPSSEDFGIKTSELEDIINMRFAIGLAPARSSLVETVCTHFMDILIWKDHLHNRFVGMKRNRLGRYTDPETAVSKERLRERMLGLTARTDPLNE